jgi:acetyl/propionyl-CoA carboxylase alpha subunit
VCSDADRDEPFAREADVTVPLGGSTAGESYLDVDAVLAAAHRTGADAVHPGYGFLAENALFSSMCAQSKVTFIGPPPHAIRLMGDKARARATMKGLGLDPIPGSEGTLRDLAHAREAASTIGCPVLLKASAGGGGKGMRVVQEEPGTLYGEVHNPRTPHRVSDPCRCFRWCRTPG